MKLPPDSIRRPRGHGIQLQENRVRQARLANPGLFQLLPMLLNSGPPLPTRFPSCHWQTRARRFCKRPPQHFLPLFMCGRLFIQLGGGERCANLQLSKWKNMFLAQRIAPLRPRQVKGGNKVPWEGSGEGRSSPGGKMPRRYSHFPAHPLGNGEGRRDFSLCVQSKPFRPPFFLDKSRGGELEAFSFSLRLWLLFFLFPCALSPFFFPPSLRYISSISISRSRD